MESVPVVVDHQKHSNQCNEQEHLKDELGCLPMLQILDVWSSKELSQTGEDKANLVEISY